MNLVDLFLIVLIALTVFVGIKRGLLISLLSALRFIVSIPLSFFVGNNYNEIIYKNYIMSYLYFQHGKVFSPVIKMYKKSVWVKKFICA